MDCGSGDKAWGVHVRHEWGAARKQMVPSPRPPLRPTLESSVLSLQRSDGRGCTQTWEPQLRAPSSVSPSPTFLLLWHPHGMSLFPHLSSVPLPASASLSLCTPPPPACPSFSVSLIPFLHLHFTACLSPCLALRQSLTPCLPSLCFALPPTPWLPPKAPVPLPSLLGPVCPSAWPLE